MALTKHLSRHGNSLALVIDRGILDLLDIDEETPLHLTTDGRSLIVTRAAEAEEDRDFEAAVRESKARYGKMYRRLARK